MTEPEPCGRGRAGWVPVVCVGVAVAVVAGAAGAMAQGALDGRDLLPRSVLRGKLQLNAVGAEQIADGAVARSELRRNAVSAEAIADGAVRAEAIRTGAVGTAEVANGSIRGEDLAPGVGLPRFTVRNVRATVSPGPAVRVTATCESGESATGGGYAGIPVGNARVLINRPQPSSQASRPTGWTVTIRNATNGPLNVQVYAVCASAQA